MPHRPRAYHRPMDVSTALNLLEEADTQALTLSPHPPLNAYADAETVVDLAGLGLDRITETSASITLGAQVTLQMMVESVALRPLANGLLPKAATYAGHYGLRNIATLSGALAAPEFAAELILALLALNAQAVIQGHHKQTLPLADYEPNEGELLLEVIFPRPLSAQGTIARVARSPLDVAIVAAVAVASQGVVTVAVAGASAKPIVKNGAVPEALGESVMALAEPSPDYRGSASYRKAMAGVLTQRAVSEALSGSQA